MSKRGLPTDVKMRHDAHYVEELTRPNRHIGRILSIKNLEPNPDQPRVEIGDLTDLTESIREKGVLEPILVKPDKTGSWMIIAGERRWRAAQLAGLREVPCIELDLDEKSIAEVALIENLQRKDLTIWEEADGLAFLSERFGHTHQEIAEKISKSRSTVTESLTIAGLPDSIRRKCRNADISAKSTLLEVARQFDETAMHKFLDDFINRGKSKTSNRQNTHKSSGSKSESVSAKNNFGKISNRKQIYRYNSDEQEFDLEIIFNNKKEYDDKDLLLALKEVFDTIKDET